MQGFAAGLMLSISFLDLAHNAINSIGFLKGNLWVSFLICHCLTLKSIIFFRITSFFILKLFVHSLSMQFFAGVVFFAVVVGFIPEPTVAPNSDVKNKKVRMIYPPNKRTFTNYACICISALGTSILDQVSKD